jgi:hypothetical protein
MNRSEVANPGQRSTHWPDRLNRSTLRRGSFVDPFAPKPAGRLSRKDWHLGANAAVL